MRVAVLVVSMLTLATTSEASSSCMSKTEARQHFGSVHIYWHGADHCWDATAARLVHRAVPSVEHRIDQPKIDQPKIDQPKTDQSKTDQSNRQDSKRQDLKPQDSKLQDSKPQALNNQDLKNQSSKNQDAGNQVSNSRDSAWRDSMSKMMPEDEAVQKPVPMQGSSVPVQGLWADRWVDIKPAQLPLSARWVDIAPVTPPPNVSAPDPELRLMVLALVLIVVALMLAMVEVLFRAVRRPDERERAVA